MPFPRSSGWLMPVFSLPESPGIGDLGDSAYQFVDFLNSAGQQIWQLLPMGPSARGNSPYSSYSAFAGSSVFISPGHLVKTGLLQESDVAQLNQTAETNDAVIDYPAVRQQRRILLQLACKNFDRAASTQLKDQLAQFCQNNSDWLEDFVLFEALAIDQDEFDWSKWEAALVRREPAALESARSRLAERIQHSRIEQFLFHTQWQSLKTYANDRGIRIYGDMPIFVAYESADVWANQSLYQLDETGRPTFVAGVPPDYFSATGQMWGNPLYDWQAHADTNYAWWIQRLRQALDSFDLLRLDHFRGFESYWEIPADAPDATSGQWKPAPGDALFGAVREALGNVPIVAEDLGLITDEVHHLRDRLSFPGMRVLQFGFEHHHDSYHRPESYPEDSVAYTGTHDNETLMGWYLRRQQEGLFQELISPFLSHQAPIHLDLINAVMQSPSRTVVIPVQDCLGLNNDSRVNTPGLPDGNWAWRCPSKALSPELAAQLRQMTESTGRLSE